MALLHASHHGDDYLRKLRADLTLSRAETDLHHSLVAIKTGPETAVKRTHFCG